MAEVQVKAKEPNVMKYVLIFAILGIMTVASLAYVSSAMADDIGKLEGITWVLESYGHPDDLTAAVPDAETTLIFNEEKKEMGGSGGVNCYGGNYETDGNKLTVKDVISTLIYGPEPVQAQENAFMKILQSAESFKIEGKQLTITGAEGVLVFSQK